ncbi:MAG: hypothetical protein ACKO2V_14525, partial [Snowella sp.]
GERIDSLQVAILKGVLKGQKYADIAQEFNCSAGHAKDEAYKLWQTLSDALGEEITKSNFRARIEKIVAKVSKNSQFVGNIQVKKLNFFPNSSPHFEKNDDVIREDQIIVESVQKKIKRETIPRLVKLGLNAEQIAEALDLPLPEVKKIIAISN